MRKQDIVQKLVTLAIKSNEYLSEDDDLRMIIINDPQIQSITPAEDRYPNIGIASYGILKQILEQGVAEKRFKTVDWSMWPASSTRSTACLSSRPMSRRKVSRPRRCTVPASMSFSTACWRNKLRRCPPHSNPTSKLFY